MAWKDRVTGRKRPTGFDGSEFRALHTGGDCHHRAGELVCQQSRPALDLTPNKKYSLSQQREDPAGLNHDVTIYAFDRQRNFGERRDVLACTAPPRTG